MKIIALTNNKGGVGKSTTATALVAILNAWGHKTLLVDADPQCNSTFTYSGETDGVATLYDLLLDDEPCSLEEAIQHTQYGDIIAGDTLLYETDDKLYGKPGRFFVLKEALAPLYQASDYEYVVIDTNPSLNTLLQSCLAAADYVVLPCQMTTYGIQGLSTLSQSLYNTIRSTNPNLKIAGILPVNFDSRSNIYRGLLDGVEGVAGKMGTKVFSTPIRHASKVEEAHYKQTPLIYYAPNCKPEKDYEKFTEELLHDIAQA